MNHPKGRTAFPRAAVLGLVAGLLLPGLPASAHDMWLQPRVFWAPAGGLVPVATLVGHGPNRERWAVDARRVTSLRSIGPGGAADHRGLLTPSALSADLPLRFVAPGTHVLALESGPAQSNLPAGRFNAYLKEEGLTPALRERQRTKRTNAAGRETYSRRAKALIQVGPLKGPQPQVTRPVGHTLEIVPERSPYALAPGGPLPVRVYYQGRPLAGATVKLTNLAADAEPAAIRLTDAAGRAAFRIPRAGQWQLNVIWTQPLGGSRRADFNTTFASLTFGFP